MGDYNLRLPQLGESLGYGRPIWERTFLDHHLRLDPAIFALGLGGLGGPFFMPQPDPALPPLLRFRPALLPPTTPGWLKPVPAAPTGPAWQVPNPKMRPGTGGDVLTAILKVPQVAKAVDHVEALAQAELKRTWKDIKASSPGEKAALGVVAVPWVIGVGFVGAKLAYEQDWSLPSIPAIPLGVPGLTLKLKYDHTVRGLVDKPLQPKEFGGMLMLDMTELIPALK